MRARARWGITPLLAAPAGAWALGLGDIELQSALNQPFRRRDRAVGDGRRDAGVAGRAGGADTFDALRPRSPGVSQQSRVSRRRRSQRPQRRPDHVARVDRRAVRDVAARGHLAARPQRCANTPCCSIRPCCCRPRRRRRPMQPAETRSERQRVRRRDQPSGRASASRLPRAGAAPPCAARPRAGAERVRARRLPHRARPAAADGGVYGPVQRAETLWAIADRLRPDGVSINQMMIAIYQANPAAFGGNINVLHAGATLRLPESADFDTLATTVANAEVRRQTDEWQNRAPQGGQLRLLAAGRHARSRAHRLRRLRTHAALAAAAPTRPAPAAGAAERCRCRRRREEEQPPARSPQRRAAELAGSGRCRGRELRRAAEAEAARSRRRARVRATVRR